MKKGFKLFFAALIALASFVPAQADELTVFDDVQTSECTPFYGYNCDVANYRVQTILPENDLSAMTGAVISSMKFYIADANGNQLNGEKLAVSVGTTDKTSYSGFSPDFVDGLTQVAEITMAAGETEVVVDFDEPWVYEGGNLVIETVVVQNGAYKHVYFYGQNASVNNVGYSSANVGGETNFYPKTTFSYTGGVEDMAKVNPAVLDFGKLFLDNEATMPINVKNIGKNAFTPIFSGLQTPFGIEAATEVAPGETKTFNVTFTAATVGEYAQTLTVDCGAAGQFEVAVTGIAAEAPTEIVVADSEDAEGYVPVFSYYYDTKTSIDQMIYPADMLAELDGKKITYVTFHPNAPLDINNGKIQMSFKEVEQTGFTDYNLITDMQIVATLVPHLNDTELTFVLDEPYEYQGGNLAIETYVLETGKFGNVKFYGQRMDYYPSLYHYGSSSSDVTNMLPKATFGYVKEDTPEPQFIRGDVNGDKLVNIADVTKLIDMLLSNAEMTPEGDCNLDTVMNIADVTKLIDFLLSGQW